MLLRGPSVMLTLLASDLIGGPLVASLSTGSLPRTISICSVLLGFASRDRLPIALVMTPTTPRVALRVDLPVARRVCMGLVGVSHTQIREQDG